MSLRWGCIFFFQVFIWCTPSLRRNMVLLAMLWQYTREQPKLFYRRNSLKYDYDTHFIQPSVIFKLHSILWANQMQEPNHLRLARTRFPALSVALVFWLAHLVVCLVLDWPAIRTLSMFFRVSQQLNGFWSVTKFSGLENHRFLHRSYIWWY